MTLEVKSEYHEKQKDKNDAKKLFQFRCFLSQVGFEFYKDANYLFD